MGINPISRKIRRRRFGKPVPLKTKLLREIAYAVGGDSIINDSSKVRKALIEITNDEALWALLKSFGGEVKKLAKYGIENGY
jgi:hypothetical protein